MRVLLILLLSELVFVGCRHPKSAEDPLSFNPTKGKRARMSSGHGGVTVKSPPRATALNEFSGKIASVNPGLRFAVLEFPLSQLPPIEQRLGIYRQGQKVGEVTISGPARDHLVAADITAGDVQVGDDVRGN